MSSSIYPISLVLWFWYIISPIGYESNLHLSAFPTENISKLNLSSSIKNAKTNLNESSNLPIKLIGEISKCHNHYK